MSADFHTRLLIKGTKDELKRSLELLRKYEDNKDVYLESIKIFGARKSGGGDPATEVYLDDLSTDSIIEEYLESICNGIVVEAGGPYGCYGTLDCVNIFEEIIGSSPNIKLKGAMSGWDVGSKQSSRCTTRRGKLHIYFKDITTDKDAYIDYVMEKITPRKFMRILKITDKECLDYAEDYINLLFGEGKIYKLTYKEFDRKVYNSIKDEAEFNDAIEIIRNLNIKNRKKYEDGFICESIYDPVKKEYI